MDEFLNSVSFNKNGDLIISSSYYTYQHWIGFIGYVANVDLKKTIKNATPLMLSTLKTGKSLDSGICCANWTSDQNFLIGTDNGEVMHYRVTNVSENLYENLMNKKEHDSLVTCIATCYDSNMALSGSEDARIKVWSLNDELSIHTYKGHENTVSSLTLNPNNNQTFISCSEDNLALLWDTRKENPALSIPHNLDGYPSASAWSLFDPNLISLGSETGQLGIYDIRLMGQKQFAKIKSNDRLIQRVEFSPSHNLIAVASHDCKTKVYRLINSSVQTDSDLENIYTNSDHIDYVSSLAWNPTNQNELLSASWDGCVKTHEINVRK